ncbi:MAG: transposase [Desulfatitalea sp.]|nr:transposase [Desulfatitalea sp.]
MQGFTMSYDPDRHRRRSIRLHGYDYSKAGAYFITVCTRRRLCLLGDIIDGEMRLNDAGKTVHTVWESLPEHYPNVKLDAFVIMPNHMHGIVWLVGAGFKPAPTKPAPTKPAITRPAITKPAGTTPAAKKHGLSEIVRDFKTFSARQINSIYNTAGTSFWQRNYYEHIIRDEESMNRIREYVSGNPAFWADYKENPVYTPPNTAHP